MTSIAAGCLAAVVLCGCGTSSPAGPAGGRDAGDADLVLPDDAAQDTGDDARDDGVATPPFPTVIRVLNTGDADVLIYFERSFACPLGLMIRSDEPATLPPTSIEPPDTTCDCSTCGLGFGGGPRCVSNDLLCQDPPITVHPGGAFDFSWDGMVLTWFDPASGADCPIRCSRFTAVPAGTYVFSLVQPAGTFEAALTTLPAPGGVVELPVATR